MTLTARSLIAELDTALVGASDSWRSAILRRISDLYFSSAELYTGDQVTVFDTVMCRLNKNIDRSLLAELSERLAQMHNTPIKFVGALARHSDIAVSGPLLAQAKTLSDKDLAEIADRDRVDMNQLIKIAAREELSETLTDVLIKRGNAAIRKAIIENPKARVSESGFARLLVALDGDKTLAAAIAARDDVPAELRVWLDKVLSE